jgi:SAM-dependent methyltransferase
LNPAEFANIVSAEDRMWWFRGMNRILIQTLEQYGAGMDILRVFEGGCGTGYLSTLLGRHFGWQVTAIDLSLDGLKHARRYGFRSAAQADLRHIPFASGVFDVVLCMDVLAHFERGEESVPVRELIRVLRPGGLFVLRASALDALFSRHSQFVEERQRFTKRRLLQAVAPAGIEVLRCTYLNTLLLPVAFTKFRLWEPLTRQKPASGVQVPGRLLNSVLELPLKFESVWLGAGLNLPLGQSLLLVGKKPERLSQTAAN